MNVLIIDDQKLCRLVQDYLHPMGNAVESAHTGREGLHKACSNLFDVIILDVMMPEMDGFEVLKTLRRESDIPVLMLTARGDVTDRIVGLEMGGDDYLPKTFSPQEFLPRLRAVTRRYSKNMLTSPSATEDELLVAGEYPSTRLPERSGWPRKYVEACQGTVTAKIFQSAGFAVTITLSDKNLHCDAPNGQYHKNNSSVIKALPGKAR